MFLNFRKGETCKTSFQLDRVLFEPTQVQCSLKFDHVRSELDRKKGQKREEPCLFILVAKATSFKGKALKAKVD